MKFLVFSKSIVGYKNKIKDKSSQDYIKTEVIKDSLICAVADGHSGEFFIKSDIGSKLACEAAIDILKEYESQDEENIKILLKEKIIQKQICKKWRELVYDDMKNSIPLVFRNNYFKYGTTLLATMIKKDYIVSIKLGDGDILIRGDKQIKRIFPSYKKYIIDCLAQDDACDKMMYSIIKTNQNISHVILYSDGFSNSFLSYKFMLDEINNKLIKYNQNIFYKIKMDKTYDKYLSDLSKNTSLDDISLIVSCISY